MYVVRVPGGGTASARAPYQGSGCGTGATRWTVSSSPSTASHSPRAPATKSPNYQARTSFNSQKNHQRRHISQFSKPSNRHFSQFSKPSGSHFSQLSKLGHQRYFPYQRGASRAKASVTNGISGLHWRAPEACAGKAGTHAYRGTRAYLSACLVQVAYLCLHVDVHVIVERQRQLQAFPPAHPEPPPLACHHCLFLPVNMAGDN